MAVEVLFVPSLSYNLLSVSKAAERGQENKFDKDGCKIVDKNGRIIAKAQRHGSLFYLDCRAAELLPSHSSRQISILWHLRAGIVPA